MRTQSRIVETQEDVDSLLNLVVNHKRPFTAAIKPGKHRTKNQNALQRMWLSEAAEQLADETAEDKRGYCKLHFGVPIMRNASDDFAESYDRIIRPLPYEMKLELMKVPLDFSVTRLMNTKQKREYLDAVHDHFRSLGVKLTDPVVLAE